MNIAYKRLYIFKETYGRLHKSEFAILAGRPRRLLNRVAFRNAQSSRLKAAAATLWLVIEAAGASCAVCAGGHHLNLKRRPPRRGPHRGSLNGEEQGPAEEGAAVGGAAG